MNKKKEELTELTTILYGIGVLGWGFAWLFSLASNNFNFNVTSSFAFFGLAVLFQLERLIKK